MCELYVKSKMTSIQGLSVELSEKFLDRCTKEQLLEIAESHAIILTGTDKKRKEDLLRAVKSQLIAKRILVVGDDSGLLKVERGLLVWH